MSPTKFLQAFLAVVAFSASTHVEAEEQLSKCELKAMFSGAHPNYGSRDRKLALIDAGEQEKYSRALLKCEYDPVSNGPGDVLNAVGGYALAAIEYWSTDHIVDARRVSALGTAILQRVTPRTSEERREIELDREMFVCSSQDNCVGWGGKAK
jgi:hypothetical protein